MAIFDQTRQGADLIEKNTVLVFFCNHLKYWHFSKKKGRPKRRPFDISRFHFKNWWTEPTLHRTILCFFGSHFGEFPAYQPVNQNGADKSQYIDFHRVFIDRLKILRAF